MELNEELLVKLHNKTVEDLISKLEEGTITPSEIASVVRLLKNNDITVEVQPGDPEETLGRLTEAGSALPFPAMSSPRERSEGTGGG